MKKIRKEVDIMGTIQDCSNVIGLHGVYEDDVQVYIVMELCNGGDLERVLEVSCCFFSWGRHMCVCHTYLHKSVAQDQSQDCPQILVMYSVTILLLRKVCLNFNHALFHAGAWSV